MPVPRPLGPRGKLRAIYSNPRKTDRSDAETLARLARLDPSLLFPIHHRSPQAQADLAVLRSRDALVRSRTLLINHVRGIVKSSGSRLPSCSAASFSKKVTASIPEPLRPALIPLLETIAALTQQVRDYDRQIEALCETKYPKTRSLQQIPGVGALTALAFVLTLEDPSRFAKSREVGPALGLVPRRDQSGDRDPQLSITKTGNAFLRRLLVGSAHYILGPFGPDCLCPARVRPAPLGLAVGRAGRQEREEEGCCGGRSKAGSAASPTMEDWRNL